MKHKILIIILKKLFGLNFVGIYEKQHTTKPMFIQFLRWLGNELWISKDCGKDYLTCIFYGPLSLFKQIFYG